MCNLHSITSNQAAIIALFPVMNHYVGNLPPMLGVLHPKAMPNDPDDRRGMRRLDERAMG
jgi:hypothetical protein